MKRIFTLAALAATCCAATAQAADEEELGILAALGLTAAEGKTEVSDKGAELEGWMLASGTLAKAAKQIYDNKPPSVATDAVPAEPAKPATTTSAAVAAKDAIPERRLILLSGEGKFDLGAYHAVDGNITASMAQLEKATTDCTASGSGTLASLTASTESSIADNGGVRLMNAIIGATKVDSKITGFDIGTPDAALINLVAGHFSEKARVPSDAIGSIDENSPLVAAFNSLIAKQKEVAGCAVGMPAANEGQKKAKAKVEAAVAASIETSDGLVAFDKDAGSSLLSRALLVEPYLSPNFDALRIKVEKGGGNLVTRKNIFLQFGFPGALSLTAGTIVSYRYYRPSTGEVLGAGMLVCRAAERDWHAVQAGDLSVEKCTDASKAADESRTRIRRRSPN